MRKLVRVLVAACVVIVVGGGAGLGFLVYHGVALDREAKAFVDASVPAIAAHWNEDALLRRSAPELRTATRPAAMSAVFARLAQYGPLVKYEGSKGQASANYDVSSGSRISASFVARALCQNGEVVFRIRLLKRNDRWQILYLHVDRAAAAAPNAPRGA